MEDKVIDDLARAFGKTADEVRIAAEEPGAPPIVPVENERAESIKERNLLNGYVLAICPHCLMVNDVTPRACTLHAVENSGGPYNYGTLVFYSHAPKPQAVALACAHCGNLLHKAGLLFADPLPIVVKVEVNRLSPYELEP